MSDYHHAQGFIIISDRNLAIPRAAGRVIQKIYRPRCDR